MVVEMWDIVIWQKKDSTGGRTATSHKFLSLHFPLEDSLVSSHLCPYNSHFLHSLYVLLILPPLIIFTFLSFPQPFLPLFNLYLPAPGPTDWVVEAAAWLHQGIAVFAAQCREESSLCLAIIWDCNTCHKNKATLSIIFGGTVFAWQFFLVINWYVSLWYISISSDRVVQNQTVLGLDIMTGRFRVCMFCLCGFSLGTVCVYFSCFPLPKCEIKWWFWIGVDVSGSGCLSLC